MSTTAEPAVGVWTNHENGSWTLTLSSRNSGILSAALVLFVGPVSIQAWSIVRFLLHQYYAGEDAEDGLSRTRQTMLRNSASPAQASWLSLRIVQAWRNAIGPRPLILRMAFTFFASFVSLILWILVGLLISSIWTSAGDHVRLSSKTCGHVALDTSSTARARSWTMYWSDRLQSASTYERQCYSASSNSSLCTRLVVPRMPWKMSDSTCPYPPQEDLCIRTNSTPMRLDTGFINSNRHLGMNSAPENSVDYRRVAQCSPMQANYISISPTGRDISYYYGHNGITESSRTYTYSLLARSLINGYTL